MQSRSKFNFFILLATLIFGVAQIAWAACSSPTASAGAREYVNGTYRLCDGTNWQDPYCASPTWTATLRGYWKMDEGSGTSAPDSSGNNVTATYSNVTLTPYGGYRDGAGSFNGTTSYVNATSAAAFDNMFGSGAGTANASISTWVYPTGLGENSNGVIIGKDNGTAAAAVNGWTLRLTGTNQLTFTIDNATTDLVRTSSNNSIALNVWSHVVLTWSGNLTATNVHIYVNGTEVTYATTTNGSGNKVTDAAQDMIIGNNRVATLGRTFAGLIDEVYVFGGILSATEIALLRARGCARLNTCATTASTLDYNATNNYFEYCDGANLLGFGCAAATAAQDPGDDYTPPSSGLVSRWKFDETSGTTADDSVGANDGTLTNMNTPSVWTSGYSNNALNFDGVNDTVSIAAPGIMGSGAATFSAWIYPRSSGGGGIGHIFHTGYQGFSCAILGWNTSYSCSHDSYVTYSLTPVNSFQANKWVHFAAVRHADNTVTIYLDGLQSGTGHQNAGTVAAGTFNSSLGSEYAGGNSFDGLIDDARIYNRELLPTEVMELAGVDLERGLVSHWKLDETSGTSAADSAGHGYTGTLTNSPTWQSTGGRVRGSLSFDGTNDYLSNASIDLSGTNAITVSAWVSRTYAAAGGRTLMEFSTNFNSPVTTGFGIFPDDNGTCSGGRIYVALNGDAGYSSKCYTQPTTGWHHLVAILDKSQTSTNEIKFYIDGVLQTAVSSPNSNENTNNFGNLPLYLFSRAGTTEYTAGGADDVRLYNRALSDLEVLALYKSAGPVLHWKLDESSGTTAADVGGNYTGTVNGSLTWSSSGGKINGAGVFDGSNDCVYNSAVRLGGTNKVTLNAWIKRDWTVGAYETIAESSVDFGGSTTGFGFFYAGPSAAGSPCGTSKVEVYLQGTGGFSGKCFNPPGDQNWHMFTAIYDKSQAGTAETALYIDGILQTAASSPHNVDNNGTTNPFATNSFHLMTRACAGAQDGSAALTGTTDDVRLYDRVLTTTEMRALYNEGLSSGLVAHWKMDESGGTTAADSSAAGNNATLTNSPVWGPTTGQINGALTFDGTNDYVSEAGIDLSGTNAVTVAAWVKRDYTAAGFRTLYEFSTDYNNNVLGGFSLFPEHTSSCSGNIMLAMHDGNNSFAENCYAVPTSNVWHHFVAVYDKTQAGGSELRFYIDGVAQTVTAVIDNDNLTTNFGNQPFYLMSRAGTLEFTPGTLDDFRIYNYAMTATEALALYNSTSSGYCTTMGACSVRGQVQYDSNGAALKWCNGSLWLPLIQ